MTIVKKEHRSKRAAHTISISTTLSHTYLQTLLPRHTPSLLLRHNMFLSLSLFSFPTKQFLFFLFFKFVMNRYSVSRQVPSISLSLPFCFVLSFSLSLFLSHVHYYYCVKFMSFVVVRAGQYKNFFSSSTLKQNKSECVCTRNHP